MLLCDIAIGVFIGVASARHGCLLQRIAGVAPNVDLGKEPNTIIEIKLATSSNRKQSKRTSFVTATVLDINQTSKFGKVQVQFANEVGTRSVNLTHMFACS